MLSWDLREWEEWKVKKREGCIYREMLGTWAHGERGQVARVGDQRPWPCPWGRNVCCLHSAQNWRVKGRLLALTFFFTLENCGLCHVCCTVLYVVVFSRSTILQLRWRGALDTSLALQVMQLMPPRLSSHHWINKEKCLNEFLFVKYIYKLIFNIY